MRLTRISRADNIIQNRDGKIWYVSDFFLDRLTSSRKIREIVCRWRIKYKN